MLKIPIIKGGLQNINKLDQHIALYNSEVKNIYKYWSDGKTFYWRYNPIKADFNTFVVLSNDFAKDKNNCFLHAKRLQFADSDTFEVLNYCYAKDKKYAWCVGGRFEPADIKTFQVCDDGIDETHLPLEIRPFDDGSTQIIKRKTISGYTKDNSQVYFYDYWGKVKVLKDVNPATFTSLNNGQYGKDDQSVFRGQYKLKGADPSSWQLLDITIGISKDAKKVFCYHKPLAKVDVRSFNIKEIVVNGEKLKLIQDKTGFYDFQGNLKSETELIDEYFGTNGE